MHAHIRQLVPLLSVSLLCTSAILHVIETDDDWQTRLWDGEELMPKHLHRLLAQGSSGSPKNTLREGDRKLQVFGMYDSGTNLLTELLRLNLGNELFMQLCPHYHWTADCHFRKHITPKDIDRQMQLRDTTGMLMVAMVRSPLAQVAGFIKAPYGLSPCTAPDALTDPAFVCRSSGESFAPGLAGIWNNYTAGYDRLQRLQAGQHQVLVLEYETLVISPEPTIRRIAGLLGVELGAEFRSIEAPAKKGGAAVGREAAIAKIVGHTYLQSGSLLTPSAVETLCGWFDERTMRNHAVQLENGSTEDYYADCEAYVGRPPKISEALEDVETDEEDLAPIIKVTLATLDKNHNDKISYNEMIDGNINRNALARKLGPQFHKLDKNEDMSLDKAELEAFTLST